MEKALLNLLFATRCNQGFGFNRTNYIKVLGFNFKVVMILILFCRRFSKLQGFVVGDCFTL